MTKQQRSKVQTEPLLVKAPTGIMGIDTITCGGLPKDRVTLVAGGPGCGKTIFGVEFLYRGATEFNEPGVFISFDESQQDVLVNASSTGFHLQALIDEDQLIFLTIPLQDEVIAFSGDFSLDVLIAQIGAIANQISAKRIVMDSVDSLFTRFQSSDKFRLEFSRLLTWFRNNNYTVVVTSERGENKITRHGIEEYVADCVIVLDHRIVNQLANRRLRILKYRGTSHSSDEFPFLISDTGLSVFPITSIRLDYQVSRKFVDTGLPWLNKSLNGKGFYDGSSVLVSGGAGTGKSSLASFFVAATAARGERSLYFSFEESGDQIVRNMQSIGCDLGSGIKKGLIQIIAERPSFYGLEEHLLSIFHHVELFKPRTIVIDPITNFLTMGNAYEIRSILVRLIDHLKSSQIACMLTSLTSSTSNDENSRVNISSLMDSWLVVRNLLVGENYERELHILKSRGMNHSTRSLPMILTSEGIFLADRKHLER